MNSEYFCVLDPDDYWTDKRRLQKAVGFFGSAFGLYDICDK